MNKDQLLVYIRQKLVLENIKDTSLLYRDAESEGINPADIEQMLLELKQQELLQLSPIKNAIENNIIDVCVQDFEAIYRDARERMKDA